MKQLYFYPSNLVASFGCSRREEPEQLPGYAHLEPGLKKGSVEAFMEMLLRGGKVKSSDGRSNVVFSDSIDKIDIVGISGKELISRGFEGHDALTFFGKVGPNKEFIFGDASVMNKEAAFLTIINKDIREQRTYLGAVLAHEMRHGFDFITGALAEHESLVKVVLEGCEGSNEEKRIVLYVVDTVAAEARAYLSQINYLLQNADRIPKREFDENIKKAVGNINVYFGIRNYIYKTHRLLIRDLTPQASRKTINQKLDAAFEAAVTRSMAYDYNSALRPYNIGINVKHENPDEMNKDILRRHFNVDRK